MNNSFIASLITSSSSKPNDGDNDNRSWVHTWFKTWHIHAVNGLSNDQTLLVHCKFKDDDLGVHNLIVGSEFISKFRSRIIKGTFFGCYMSFSNHQASFKVFWDNYVLYNMCDWGTCIWTAKDDRIYLKNIPKNQDVYCYDWEQGRL
ncbi:hypothetical protein E1A91_A08G212300v1 [Gossypium mustelinum]|uniref:S-protein homolog n=1 Tax=Gossypium mustelinum TaxID=34275 RepID=A0A5D2YCN2_GOSMU|nr:hypothetical protein E1A91_A08G212300v1 [Gossypium mustelinum]